LTSHPARSDHETIEKVPSKIAHQV